MMIVRNQDKDYITFLENVQGISVCEELDERASVVFEYANKIKIMGRYRSYDIAREVANTIRKAYLENNDNSGFDMPPQDIWSC
ncbi:hypothetical protein DW225_00840 [Ruminococcus sp. AM18-44]|nr:hypothetical protein DW225_00840 [Ruminococcus sp. AM18-44]